MQVPRFQNKEDESGERQLTANAPRLTQESPEPFETEQTNGLRSPRNCATQYIKRTADAHKNYWLYGWMAGGPSDHRIAQPLDEVFLLRRSEADENDPGACVSDPLNNLPDIFVRNILSGVPVCRRGRLALRLGLRSHFGEGGSLSEGGFYCDIVILL